jgi:hypothetical protein
MLPAFDATVTLGNVIEIGTIISGGLWFLVKMSTSVKILEEEVLLLQKEITKLSDVLTQLAIADTRLNNLEQDVREIRVRLSE